MKYLILPDGNEVALRKSKRAKKLTLKVTAEGAFEATIPFHIPYLIAEQFIKKHQTWIQENKPQKTAPLVSGKQIGKQHKLVFAFGKSKLGSRVSSGIITVAVPTGQDILDQNVQQEAKKAAIRALRREAEELLPTMLHTLSHQYGYTYKQVQVKKMRSRWGSCSSAKSINLSIWLMQLPEDLIEYVLCHELTHLHHMNHSNRFWGELAEMIPDYRQRRNALKMFSPRLM